MFMGQMLFAQNKQNLQDTTQIEEVKIYANPSPKALNELARVVTVLSKNELQNTAASNIQSLLNANTTVDLQNRGTDAQADISIRGGSFDQTLLMVNGIAINDPQTGHMNLNLMFDKDDIKQIEILKGSGSKVFGPNAFSGAVNFVIEPNKKNQIKLKSALSDYNTYKVGFTINNNYKGWNNYLTILKKQSDGYVYNTETDSKNLFFLSQGKIKNTQIAFMYGVNDNAFGANSFYHWASKEQWEQIRTQLAALKIGFGTKIKTESQLYWKRNYDKYIWKPIYAANLHRTDIYGIKNTVTLKKHFTFLLDIKKEKMLSNSMGLDLGDVVAVPKETDKFYTKGVERTNTTLSLNYHYTKDSFTLSTGANANYNTAFNWNFATGIELSKKMEQWEPYLALNTAYRLPTFFDLYYNSSSNEGNPNLLAEKAITYETGLKYNSSLLQGTLALFSRAGKDVIDWARPSTNTTAKYRSQNIGSLTTYGAELSLKLRPRQQWEQSSINYINLSAMLLDQKQKLDGQLSKYAFVYLKNRVNLAINHQVVDKLSATWELQYTKRSGTYASYDTGLIKVFEPYLLANFQLLYQVKDMNFYIKIANVADKSYYNTGSLPQAGRWFGGGLTYTINY
jgi:iron complex outermembrane receptor protein